MGIVTLLSGGLDSSLVALMVEEEGISQFPLFVDYGQINKQMEWNACLHVHKTYNLPEPRRINLPGWGESFPSGLTDKSMDIVYEAFLPNRNLLFLLAGSAYAHQQGADAVAIGLLNDAKHLFPDQTHEFVTQAENMVSLSLGRHIRLLTPLIEYTKADVIAAAEQRGLTGTYSCHAGGDEKCGRCISCMEFNIQQGEV
jgi:7-cyano-7-deazaguanine synthase